MDISAEVFMPFFMPRILIIFDHGALHRVGT